MDSEVNKSMQISPQDLNTRIQDYRQENIDFSQEINNSYKGLRNLFSMVDRHYYINLETRIDPVKRKLWMYFPSSHLPSWPKVDPLLDYINNNLLDLRLQKIQKLPSQLATLGAINATLRETFDLQHPFNDVKIIHKSISELNDLTKERYDIDAFVKRTKEDYETQYKLFFAANNCPDDYFKFSWGIEKQFIFDELDDNKIWIYYPIFYRHIWISLLAMRVPLESLCEVGHLLPLFSSVIGEKILSVCAKLGWEHPIASVRKERDVVSLMSIVAAQCGLSKLSNSPGSIAFKSNQDINESVIKFCEVPSGWRRFEFYLAADKKEYFEQIFLECKHALERFGREIRHRNLFIRAALMSRNFSHNVGSHSIANPNLYSSLNIPKDGTGNCIKNRLGIFHGYAQGRLDFMARAVNKSDDFQEPLLFVSDVMNGFFRQGVLLDTLLEDTGFRAQKLEFIIELIENEAVRFIWINDETQHRFLSQTTFNDVVVGIPGGQIGCHALYAFLENCLRNAVKYGTKNQSASERPPQLRLTLRLEKCTGLRFSAAKSDLSENAWVLRICDNVSTDPHFKITKSIRGHLKKGLSDDDENTSSEGHGIQEMKVCAEILAGGDNGLRFASDGDAYSGTCDPSCSTCKEYKEFATATKDDPVNIEIRQPLRCYSVPNREGENFLVYNLLLHYPILLGIVRASRWENDDNEVLNEFVRRLDYKNLAKSTVQFGIILDDVSGAKDVVDDIIKKIACIHPILPYRLMVITTIAKKNDWEVALSRVTGRESNKPFARNVIPRRRVRVLADDNLLILLNSKKPTFDYLGAKDWEAVVLKVYDVWLREYKPLPSGIGFWNLCIGFQRSPDGIIPRWDDVVKRFSKEEGACVSIHVIAQKKGCTEMKAVFSPNSSYLSDTGQPDVNLLKLAKETEQRADYAHKCFLIFDNHGKIFGGIGNKTLHTENTRFFQKVGAAEGLSLYQSLESPPQSPFGFGFFIYTLAEAALTRVAVIDERVAQSTIDDLGRLLHGEELPYQNAGILPLMRVQQTFLSSTIENFAKENKEYLERTMDEGCNFMPDGSVRINFALRTQQGMTTQSLTGDSVIKAEPLDVLVFHEGVSDILYRRGLWSKDDVWKLYDASPIVVRTSGRGRDSRYLGDWLPFIEFTELSENTYRSLNKMSLIKSLLSSGGDLEKLP